MTPTGTPQSTKPGWRFGVFEVDASRGELRRAGIPLKLRDQSFQILVALLEVPGEIVTREDLRHRLWPSDTFVDFDHSLNTAMMKLRDALGDSTEAPIYIETIPKRGYRFIAPVSSIATAPEHTEGARTSVRPTQLMGAPPEGPVDSVAPSTARRVRWIIAAAGILLIALTLALVFPQLRQPKIQADGESSNYRIAPVTTFRGSVKDPAITPDGRDVAYAWNGGGGDHYDIYVQRIGSTMPMRLTYIKTGFVGRPAWSPDQREIAFTLCDGMNDGVYIVPALGGPERKLTGTSCQYHVPTPVVWLAGGQMVMLDRCPASGLHGIAVFSMETGQKRCIADLGPYEWNRRIRYAVSPDEKTVAFTPTREDPVCALYTVPLSGGSPHRILTDKGSCDGVMWAPDGKNIVLLTVRTALYSVWQVPVNGGQIRESNYPAMGTFSKDGLRFVFMEQSNGEPQSVWRADLAVAGGKVLENKRLIATQFPEMDSQPSPDGARLVWAERRGGNAELWTGNSTGENPMQLTHLSTYAGTPRWSPDGNWIVFDAESPEGPQINVIDAEGRNLRAITHGRYMNIVPSWSRDGKAIYFSSRRSGTQELWKHFLDTGEELKLTTQGGFHGFESFDGQTVYFTKFDEAGIWSMPSNGGRETLVLQGRPQILFWGHWALTRSGIYFLNADVEPRARIEFYEFASRRTWPVFSLEKSAAWAQPSLSATADGKTIYYTQSDPQSVIKMMEFSR